MISFALEEDQQIIQETVRKFAAEELRPKMRELEKSRRCPTPCGASSTSSGSALDDVEAARRAGRCAARGAGVRRSRRGGRAVRRRYLAARALAALGDERAARLPLRRPRRTRGWLAGSERKAPLDGFSTVARRDGGGWVLDGKRRSSSTAAAPTCTSSSRSSRARRLGRRGAFVVESGQPGAARGERARAARPRGGRRRTRSSSRAAGRPTAIGCRRRRAVERRRAHVRARDAGQRRAAGGPGARRLRVRAGLHAGAQGVRQAGGALPGDRLHARRHGDGRRGRALDGVARRHRARQGHAVARAVAGRGARQRGRLAGGRQRRAAARRRRLRAGLPGREVAARHQGAGAVRAADRDGASWRSPAPSSAHAGVDRPAVERRSNRSSPRRRA